MRVKIKRRPLELPLTKLERGRRVLSNMSPEELREAIRLLYVLNSNGKVSYPPSEPHQVSRPNHESEN